jgi:hypothetical protein
VSSTGEATLPLRPLTVGELLDAAVALLRRGAVRLLLLAGLVAVVEQLVLVPFRGAAGVVPPQYVPDVWNQVAGYWGLLALGAGTEAVALALLGAAAARTAVPALLGSGAADPHRLAPQRYLAVAGLALGTGLIAMITWFVGFVGWPLWFAASGLTVPVLVTDLRHAPTAGPPVSGRPAAPSTPPRLAPVGVGQAIGRGLGLVFRAGLRPGLVRLVNYLAWLLFRLALGWGVILAMDTILQLQSPFWRTVLAMTGFAVGNTIAYAAGGCVDAVVHLEARIRMEALDIAVGNARRRGLPIREVLAVPRRPATLTWAQAPAAPGAVPHPPLVRPPLVRPPLGPR